MTGIPTSNIFDQNKSGIFSKTILFDFVPGFVNQVTVMLGTVKDEWTRNLGWFIEELLQERNELGIQPLTL